MLGKMQRTRPRVGRRLTNQEGNVQEISAGKCRYDSVCG